jgi:hypothetical protein
VFDVISDDLIGVYVTGLNEAMTFPLASIRPCRPKVNQRCKILSGPNKGETGLLVSASGNQGFVRVHRTKQVVGIEFESLSWITDEAAAAIESEIGAATVAPDCCLLTIFSSGSFGLSLLTLYVPLLHVYDLLRILYLLDSNTQRTAPSSCKPFSATMD